MARIKCGWGLACWALVCVSGCTLRASAARAKKLVPEAIAASVVPGFFAGSVTDTFFDVTVADPYRELEDTQSPATQHWVQQQDAAARRWLDAVPARRSLTDSLRRLGHTARLGVPSQTGSTTLFAHNRGGAPYDTYYTGDPSRAKSTWRLAIEPNELSEAHAAIAGLSTSPDGKYLAYATSVAGSDWQVWRIRRLDNRTDLPDCLEDIKAGSVAWRGDAAGFFYSRLQKPPLGAELTARDTQSRVFYHHLGAAQASDTLVFAHADLLMDASAAAAEDDTAVVILTHRGSDRRCGVYAKSPRNSARSFERLVADCTANYTFIGAANAQAYFVTTAGAPRRQIVRFDVRNPAAAPVVVVPESENTLHTAHWVGDSLIAVFIKDATAHVQRFTLKGELLSTLWLPETCWVTGFGGGQHAMTTYYTVTNSAHAGTIYKLTMTPRDWHAEVIFTPDIDADLSVFTTYRAFAQSTDGTRVPLIISHLKGLQCRGDCPTRMYGYGGFTLPVYPAFNVPDLLWMAHGGVTVRTATRGGGEYGELWHQAGMRGHKQNTFDDFAAAARWLVEQGYTRPQRLGIEGTSNGGLLVAASLTQHPELFGAVVCQVGVLDMLRFAHFTQGQGWVTEYGDVQVQSEFRALLAYSPVHNARRGVHYPATLLMTADHDDRVVPAHSYKFAAALQAAQAGPKPILLRVSRNTGHGAGMSFDQAIEQEADRQAFFAEVLGLSNDTVGLFLHSDAGH